MARVPRIARLEFITDFLEGLNEGLDDEKLEQKLASRKFEFEREKYRALGRGAPFSEKQKKVLSVGRFKLSDCEKMCSILGLIYSNGRFKLSDMGNRILRLKSREQRDEFGSLFLNNFLEFANFLLQLNISSGKELSLPDIRHSSSKQLFGELAKSFGIDLDAISFNHMRDLLSQIGYINWYPEKSENEVWSKTYLTCQVHLLEKGHRGTDKLPTFVYNSNHYSVELNDCSAEVFSITAWEEYMQAAKDVQWKPVFYADLRARTCERLRICDEIFDSHLFELLRDPSKFKTVWSGGTIPRSVDSASLLKNLPPHATEDDYMVYLMIGRN